MNQRMRFEGMEQCDRFEEIGKRIVAFAVDSKYENKVMVFENGDIVHTCGNAYENWYSVLVEGSKVYFPSLEGELIEFDAETFEEKVLLQKVRMMTAAPDQPDFLAVSWDGILQTRGAQKDLEKVFPRMGYCNWTAGVSVGFYAVLAGYSESSLLDRRELPRPCNYFLLVRPQTLEVVNQACPLSVEWSQNLSISVVYQCRLRAHRLHAML